MPCTRDDVFEMFAEGNPSELAWPHRKEMLVQCYCIVFNRFPKCNLRKAELVRAIQIASMRDARRVSGL